MTIEKYATLSEQELTSRIDAMKRKLGKRLVILAHHYQLEETFRFADFTGDSLKLAQSAANQRDAEYIIFCGVHFMAETARMLCAPEQHVILPDTHAGCPLAEFANIEQVETCWEILQSLSHGKKIIPITYINSTADIKSFCGLHDGIVCTSGNAQKVLRWAFDTGDMLLFLPDQHLGRNTGYQMGMKLGEMALYNPAKQSGGISKLDDDVKIVLWAGYCNAHMKFSEDDVKLVRKNYPEAKIIVHPECKFEVVQAADLAGSTEMIIRTVSQSKEKVWAIGTEKDMVDRLARKLAPEKKIFSLSPQNPSCFSMKLCNAAKLLWVLENLANGKIVNEVFVDSNITENARSALKQMLELTA